MFVGGGLPLFSNSKFTWAYLRFLGLVKENIFVYPGNTVSWAHEQDSQVGMSPDEAPQVVIPQVKLTEHQQ